MLLSNFQGLFISLVFFYHLITKLYLYCLYWSFGVLLKWKLKKNRPKNLDQRKYLYFSKWQKPSSFRKQIQDRSIYWIRHFHITSIRSTNIEVRLSTWIPIHRVTDKVQFFNLAISWTSPFFIPHTFIYWRCNVTLNTF